MRLLAMAEDREDGEAGIGSTLLIPQLLTKPTRTNRIAERNRLIAILGRLYLVAVDDRIADLAVTVGAEYRLESVDAVHLATPIFTGADRFITNNRRDFDAGVINEIEVVYPDQLAT